MFSRDSLRHFIKQSLPTPLGPLITMIRGLGVGTNGSELNGEPRDVSSARYSSVRSVNSTAGIRVASGLPDSLMSVIDEKSFLVMVVCDCGLNWLKKRNGFVRFLAR